MSSTDPDFEARALRVRDLPPELLAAWPRDDAGRQLCVGDQVQINHTIKPRYLHGLHGTIIDVDDERATVRLHRPVRRFHTGEIRCPPLTLDKLAKAS